MESTKLAQVAIRNTGEIDINAFCLIGASTKRGDETKIGFFGSGLKYAIAVLLREGVQFEIYSGEKKIEITTKKHTLGGHEFDVIEFDGRSTSLTTSMGIDWKLWFAIREIYCNAIDEGDCTLEVVNESKGIKGTTTFFISLEKINDIFLNWKNYFSTKRDDLVYDSFGLVKFFSAHGKLLVYRKGIQVLEREEKNLFDYDFKNIEINESRVVKSEFELNWNVVNSLKSESSEEIIKQIMHNKGSWEAKLDWSYGGGFSNKWLDVLKGKLIILEDTSGNFLEEMNDYTIILPNRLALALKEQFGEKIKIMGLLDKNEYGNTLEITDKQKKVIEFCLDFLKDEIDVTYEVQVCDFENKQQLGGVDKTKELILLSPRVFDEGKKQVLMTIIEEYSHLYSNAGDKTRRFQDFLINHLVSVIENKKNILL